jgi:predicted NBD/HSP70 family sugar kinase
MLCIENVASGQAVVKLLQSNSNEPSPPATVAELVRALNSEQAEREDARAALKRAAEMIGVVLADVARLADPSRIVVGGLLALTGETFVTPLRIAFSSAGLSGLDPQIESVPPDDITRVELQGAVALALKLVRFPWQHAGKPEAEPVLATV